MPETWYSDFLHRMYAEKVRCREGGQGHKLPGKARGLPLKENWLIDCHVKVYAGDAADEEARL